MKFKQALRLAEPAYIALVGAGGKTTAMFQLARQLDTRVLVSTSTHLAIDQIALADQHIIIQGSHLPDGFQDRLEKNVILVTGPAGTDDRVHGLNLDLLQALHAYAREQQISLLLEADGSRRLPLKAPTEHEPVIPTWANTVIVCAGMQGLDKSLTDNHVHRPDIFGQISQAALGDPISAAHIAAVLLSSKGGLKNVPEHARRVALLNQADTLDLQAQSAELAETLLEKYDAVLTASLRSPSIEVVSVHEKTAGILLAAGGSIRLGQPKILLDWNGVPFIRKEVETALAAGLSPVIVVLGAVIEPALEALQGLPVQIVINKQWQAGQSRSVRAGIKAAPESAGAAIFLLGDQPQVSPEVLEVLIKEHQRSLSPIIAPQVMGKRANPVLFDRFTFSDLQKLEGDQGGRSLFQKFPVRYIDWHDKRLTLDVDTMDDYKNLLDAQ